MPSAYANQSAGELSSMCDAPQTTEALTVRRSRDAGGVGFHSTQKSVLEVLEEVWKSEPRGKEGQGTEEQTRPSRKLGIGSWREAKVSCRPRLRLVVGGMALGFCRVGAIVSVERPGPLPLMPSNQVGPRASSGVIVSDTRRAGQCEARAIRA